MTSLRLTGITLIAIAAGCFDPHYSNPGFACNLSKGQTCPPGQMCNGSAGVDGVCIDTSGGTSVSGDGLGITKTTPYMTPTANAMLDNESECPDKTLEPDDDFGQAVDLTGQNITVGGNPLKLQNLSICPTGPNPAAKNHDVDLFKITVPSAITAVVEITYDIQYGDLDLGIFDTNGNSMGSDGTSVSNACVAAPLTGGTYYIGVFGAKNQDVNRYSLTVKYSASGATCGT